MVLVNLVVTGWRGRPRSESEGDPETGLTSAERATVQMFVVYALTRYTGNRVSTAKLFVGDARGVDAVVRRMQITGVENRVYVADWKGFGREAGPKRNHDMLCEAVQDNAHTVVLAIPHPTSHKGTMNCVEQAVRLGLPVDVRPLEVEV